MKRLASGVAAALLAGCASAPAPPGTQVSADRMAQLAVPGQATRASLLAAFGPTHTVVFDSGYESWLYRVPAGVSHGMAEFVVLLGPDGVVRKTRVREPLVTDKPAK